MRTYVLPLELLLDSGLPLVQSAEAVDLVLVFAPYFDLVALGGFLFFRELII